MWSDKKIALIMDTNIYEKNEKAKFDFSTLPLERYYKIIKTIELNNLKDEVNIFFPEIVILELLAHHKNRLKENLSELDKLNSSFINFSSIEIKGMDKISIDETIEDLKEKYFNELNIIEIPKKNDLFNEILKMSLEKIPPFEGNSDKGFKDAILFLSIVDYAKNNHFDKFVLFSKDKVFKNHEIDFKKRFNYEVHGKKGFIKNSKEFEINDSSNISEFIISEFELFNDLKNHIQSIFLSILENDYESKETIEINSNDYEISEFELIEDDIFIYQLEENQFEVEFYLYVYFYAENDDWFIFDEDEKYIYKNVIQSESYIFEKIDDQWEYSLNSQSYYVS